MCRGPALAVLFGCAIGLALGCGSSPGDASGGDGGGNTRGTHTGGGTARDGDPPRSPIKVDDLPSAKARLTKLEKDIEAKEKELGDLKAEADALRKQIAAAEAPKDKLYRTPEELFADMPKEAYPKFGPAGGNRASRCPQMVQRKPDRSDG